MFDTFERVKPAEQRRRAHCNECERTTIHTVEAQCVARWDDDGSPASGGSTFSILRCGACDAVAYETASWNSEWIEHDGRGEPYNPKERVQYPTPVTRDFSFDTEHTPHRLDELLEETLSAFGNVKYISATVMLRLVIEFIVKDVKSGGRTLEKKIGDLLAKSHIDEDQHDLLQKIRKRGNASAHDAIGMSAAELIAGMDVIKLLIERLYNAPGRQKYTVERAKKVLT